MRRRAHGSRPMTLRSASSSWAHIGREQLVSALERAAFNACGTPLPPPRVAAARADGAVAAWTHRQRLPRRSSTTPPGAPLRSDPVPCLPVGDQGLHERGARPLVRGHYRDLASPSARSTPSAWSAFASAARRSSRPNASSTARTTARPPLWASFCCASRQRSCCICTAAGSTSPTDSSRPSPNHGIALASTTDVKNSFHSSVSRRLCVPDQWAREARRAAGRLAGGDVVLPPWAASPADFVSRCREALDGGRLRAAALVD